MSGVVQSPREDGAVSRRGARAGGLLRLLEFAIIALGVLFVVLAGGAAYLYSISRTLPAYLDIRSDAFPAPRTTTVYAADGSVLAEWNSGEDRHVVPIDDVAQPMQQAVVAVEDERFYEHAGVDWTAVMRAARVDVGSRTYAQGASTITQQLVKVLFTGGERTFGRKVREVLLAYQLESKADKRRVLEAYLNAVYFGHGAYGIESAARSYFGKSASALTLPESALLAAIIRSPTRYSPLTHPEQAKARRDLVLKKMREQGYITSADEVAAREHRLGLASAKPAPPVAPYFVEYVRQDLIAKLGKERVLSGGLSVQTTLDPKMQRVAERSASKALGEPGDPDVAVVSLEPSTGHVLAMVGGRDFKKDQFNLAVQGRRQPGSAFKPFLLVTALEQGISPDRMFEATPYTVAIPGAIWRVDNYENAATVPSMSLRTATDWSVNCVFARLIMMVGPQHVVDTAHAMGITSELDANPAIALGGLRRGVSPLEMASAYGTLANQGMRVAPSGVSRVTDPAGNVLYASQPAPTRAIPPQVASTAAAMLHDVVEHGTGQAARTARWGAGKTGTTQSWRDAWFVGWSGDLVTSVWVGYADKQRPMVSVHGIRVTGGSYPALIWNAVMSRSTSAQPVPGVVSPGDLVRVRVCTDSMQRANPRCPSTVDMYLPPRMVPTQICTRH
jgi:penicillin-binding protein 1A